jgi:hypothetical protein
MDLQRPYNVAGYARPREEIKLSEFHRPHRTADPAAKTLCALTRKRERADDLVQDILGRSAAGGLMLVTAAHHHPAVRLSCGL